jgi:hypothetical protein
VASAHSARAARAALASVRRSDVIRELPEETLEAHERTVAMKPA